MMDPSLDRLNKFNGNDIIIIGGGQSILNHKLGKFIDSFPTIGRINNYKTYGFEEFIGSKTNIWFNGANQGLKKNKVIPHGVVVLIPPNIWAENGGKIHDRIIKRLNTNSYELVPKKYMDKFESEVNTQRLTTGTNSILWALENFNRVYIHGFDFFIDSKTHYNDGKIKKWLIENGLIKKAQKHNTAKEKQYIEKLISQGKIIKLVDIIS